MKLKKIIPLLALMTVFALALPCLAAEEEDAANPYELDAVTVTSQKVEADKQDVPGVVTVFDAQKLDDLNIERLDELILATPNINFQKQDAHTTQLIFRGVGGLPNMNKVWNINVDGVAVPYVAIDTFLDVERIEVLRGAQSSLYGRNTHAGAVNIITKAPTSEPTLDVNVDYGRFNTLNANTAFGDAISDSSAYRMALGYKRSDGYIKNTTLDRDDTEYSEQFTGRGKIEMNPSNKAKLTLSLYADGYTAGFDGYAPEGAGATLKVQNNIPGYNTGYLISPTVTYEEEIDGKQFTSITNFSRSTYGYLQDWDFSSADTQSAEYTENFNTFTQEFRLNGGQETDLEWLVGVFGLLESFETTTDIRFGANAGAFGLTPGDFTSSKSTVDSRAAAVFGKVVYLLNPSIELTGSLRVDYSEKTLDWENDTNITAVVITEGTIDRTDSWLQPSPSVSAAYIMNENERIYLTLSRGFKAGDYNNVMTEIALAEDPVDPEYANTVEIGYKSRHFDNTLEFNAAAFYVDWKDLQVDVDNGSSSLGNRQKLNASEATTAGVEMDFKARVAKGWDVFGAGGYMIKYEFDDFQFSSTVDYDGNKLPSVNDYTATLGSVYRSEDGLFLSGDFSLRGRQFFEEANTNKQEAYAVVNAKVGYEQEMWDAYIYGRNLTDTRYASIAFNGAYRADPPLSIGAQAHIRF